MKYSICIPFRNRHKHLSIIVPYLRKSFADVEHEIVIAEQDDNKILRRGNLRNEAAKAATGDVFIFHDVDYFLPEGSHKNYFNTNYEVYLPVHKVIFKLSEDLSDAPENRIPGGYRHFKNKVDDDFHGGVVAITKESFYKIGGYNPLFKGWGFEDREFGFRIEHYDLKKKRDEHNTFWALLHEDSGPPVNDPNLQRNMQMCFNYQNFLQHSVKTQDSETKFNLELAHNFGVDTWVKATFLDDIVPMENTIVSSKLNFDD